MTKEELEKESQQYALSHTTPSLYRVVDQAYLAGAEPREKQIEIDAEQIRALQKQNGELTDELTKKADTNHQLVEQLAKLNERCSELEAQVEKMKNCKNCKKLKKEKDGLLICTVGSFYTNTFGENCDKWEIKEK